MEEVGKPEISMDLDAEKYCGVLAVYGNALKEGFQNPAYQKSHINNFTGEELDQKIDILTATGYLERHKSSNWNNDVYAISEEVEDEAEQIMSYVDQEYGGDISSFIDDFSQSDEYELPGIDALMDRD